MALTLRLPSSVVFLGAIACQSGGPCETAECSQEAADELSVMDVDEQVLYLSHMDDALERIRLISHQIDRHPAQASLYCDLLPRGLSQQRCVHVSGREHLWSEVEETSDIAARAGPGPTHSRLRAVDIPFSDWIHVRAVPGAFSGEVDVHAQAWAEAIDAVHSGRIDEVGPACAGVQAGTKWRYDCFYSAAQAHVTRWGRANVNEAIKMCGAAGFYRGLCVMGVVRQLASSAPPSGVGDPVSWAPVLMAAHDLRKSVDQFSASEDILDRFWAEVALNSVDKAVGVSGDLLDALPAGVAPHVRSAVALRVLSASDAPLSFSDATRVVANQLNRRVSGRTGLRDERLTIDQDFWPIDREGEAHLSAIVYLGVSRRTVAADPEVDTKIAVLEAASRLHPPWMEAIGMGKVDADQRVRWTAARLEERLGALAIGESK